jgi:hypothetical protein
VRLKKAVTGPAVCSNWKPSRAGVSGRGGREDRLELGGRPCRAKGSNAALDYQPKCLFGGYMIAHSQSLVLREDGEDIFYRLFHGFHQSSEECRD